VGVERGLVWCGVGVGSLLGPEASGPLARRVCVGLVVLVLLPLSCLVLGRGVEPRAARASIPGTLLGPEGSSYLDLFGLPSPRTTDRTDSSTRSAWGQRVGPPVI
jgi:hypothetical protein